MTNKERYRQLCETEGLYVPLFQQYWWMETVCAGKQWDVLLCEEHGRLVGALPYLYGKKWGLKYIMLPLLTPWNGPWIDPSLDVNATQTVLASLAQAVRDLHPVLYLQKFSPDVSDWLPFYWAGFRQTTRYTYRFDPLPAPSELRALAAKERRKGIETVEAAYHVDRNVGVEEFADFHTAYWERRGGHDWLSRIFIIGVCRTALERGQALLYGLRGDSGALMAARFVVYDGRCAYSLLSALHPDALRNSMTLLVWTLMADLYGRSVAFDFEGSMDPGIEHFYRSFGTRQTPLHCVYFSRLPFVHMLLKL